MSDPGHDPDEAVVILEAALADVQRRAERLRNAGIDCAIVKPPEGRGSS
jgi:hypothetical protein